MEYAAVVEVYQQLERTDADLEQVELLADCLASASSETLPMLVGTVRGKVFEPWEEADLGVSSSLTLDAIETATGRSADEIEAVWREEGDLGDAAAWAVEHATQQSLGTASLSLSRVYETLRGLAAFEGEGSQQRKVGEVAGLLADADPAEARYVARTALGHMRLGVGDGTVRDAIAAAFLDDAGDAASAVERAHQVTTDYRLVAETAREAGREGLAALDIELGRPVRSMLAKKAEGLEAGVTAVADDPDDVLLEYKYDGARVQIHHDHGDVWIYTRRLVDVTAQFPEVVEAVEQGVTAERCLLDGELVGHDPETGAPVPFQEFSRRIKRTYDIAELAAEIPATLYLFDAISVSGNALVEQPLRERLARLDGAFDPDPGAFERATSRRYDGTAGARSFYQDALSAGHEGVMVKNLAAAYQPGDRVGYMAKVKPVMEPLDLVVTRAQWSEGRRSDYLGRLFVGCRDGDGGFAEVGRLSTGFTDEELAALTETLTDCIVAEDGRQVDVRPAVVLEVEYEEIQVSPEYDSGYALRFPRFLDVREDCAPTDADRLARVERLYDQQ
jgi:DNA ligase-1